MYCCDVLFVFCLFVFKQKTAYEMRISDWSSDVCSSDLKTVSIASDIANAYIDFSKMTCSVVAVVTDVIRDGRPVIGYGFNSNGRYGQGALMRERFFPRLAEAAPERLVDEENDNLDPFAIWRSEEHTSELQSLMRISYAVFCLKKQKPNIT